MAPIDTIVDGQPFTSPAAAATISTPLYATAAGTTVVAQPSQTITAATQALTTISSSSYTNVTISSDGSVSYSGFSSTSCRVGSSASSQSSSTCYQASDPGATAQFSFTGVAVYIYGVVGPTYGVFSVTVDEQVYSNLSGYYQEVETGVVIFSQNSLSDGTHTVIIENLGASTAGGADLTVEVILATSSSGTAAAAPVAVGNTVTVQSQAANTIAASTQFVTPTTQYVTTTNAFGQVQTVAVTGQTEPNNNSNTGAIIGGVIGAVLFLVILSYVFGKQKDPKAETVTTTAPAATPSLPAA